MPRQRHLNRRVTGGRRQVESEPFAQPGYCPLGANACNQTDAEIVPVPVLQDANARPAHSQRPLQEQHASTGFGQQARGGQPANSTPDNHDIPAASGSIARRLVRRSLQTGWAPAGPTARRPRHPPVSSRTRGSRLAALGSTSRLQTSFPAPDGQPDWRSSKSVALAQAVFEVAHIREVQIAPVRRKTDKGRRLDAGLGRVPDTNGAASLGGRWAALHRLEDHRVEFRRRDPACPLRRHGVDQLEKREDLLSGGGRR